MANVARLLDQLLPGFQRVELTVCSAERTHNLALELRQAARAALEEDYAADGDWQDRMVALAQALLAFGPLAAEALPTLLVYPVVRPPMLLQLVSACTTLAALAQLAGAAGVQRRTAFHVAAACQLVFDLGQRTMTVLVAQADQAAALGQPPDRRALAALGFLCISQLTAVAGVLRLLRQQAQGNTQAAFARSTAKPGALLPWLLVVLRALELSAPYFELPNPAADKPGDGIIAVVSAVLMESQFEGHEAAVADDPAAQDAITAALLTRCGLQRLVAAFAEAAPAGLPLSQLYGHAPMLLLLIDLVAHATLQLAVERFTRGPAAVAALRSAAAFVAAAATLPADLPADLQLGSEVDPFLDLHFHAAQLLALCCRGRVQRPAATGDSSSGGGGGDSSSDAAPLLSSEQLAAAWELMAAVPHIAAAIRALVAGANARAPDSSREQALVVTNYGYALAALPVELQLMLCSAAQLSTWAAAAQAGLRLQPLLLQLSAASQEFPASSPEQVAAGQLAAQLLAVVWMCPFQEEGAAGSGAAAEPEPVALRHELLQAHLAGCRLVHWLAKRAAAGGSMFEFQGSRLSQAVLLLRLLGGLCGMLTRYHVLEPHTKLGGVPARAPSSKRLAPYMAHLEAARELAALVAAACSNRASLSSAETHMLHEGAMALAYSVNCCLASLGDLAAAAAFQPLQTILGGLPKDDESAQLTAAVVRHLWYDAPVSGRCAAAFISSGLLAAGMEAVLQLCPPAEESSPEASACMLALQNMHAVLVALIDAADAAHARVPVDLSAQLDEAAQSLRGQQEAALASTPADAPPAEQAAQLRQLLQPVADLAALMEQYYALPAAPCRRLTSRTGWRWHGRPPPAAAPTCAVPM